MSVTKQKLWSDERIKTAYQAVLDGKGLREMSRLYNVPVETLRRRVNGTVLAYGVSQDQLLFLTMN